VSADFWRKELTTGAKGGVKPCLANIMHVLAVHPEWSGVLAYDLFGETVITLKGPPMRAQDRPRRHTLGDWSETDTIRTAAWFEKELGISVSVELITQAVIAIAERHTVHPVRDWLSGLVWDGLPRLDKMLHRYFGAPDEPYTNAVSAKFMISAVARVMSPGCKCDTMLILEGKQGTKKSTGVKILAVDWYADTGVNVGEKDSYQALRHVWIYEFAELAAIRGREAERVKNFLSSSSDHYRPSYGRKFRDFPRQTVCVATTNDDGYLVDRTGNRRFWPVRCGRVDADALQTDRDALWAEAAARHAKGEAWHIDTSELAALCNVEQAERQAPDDWLPIVALWLLHPTVPDGYGGRTIVDLDLGPTTAQVLLGAIGMYAKDIHPAMSMRAGHVLRALGYEPKQKREAGDVVRRYRLVTPSPVPGCDSGCDNEAAPAELDSSLSHPSHPNVYAHTQKNSEGRDAGSNGSKSAVTAVTCDSPGREEQLQTEVESGAPAWAHPRPEVDGAEVDPAEEFDR
jgi:putative DNA primase/helicase